MLAGLAGLGEVPAHISGFAGPGERSPAIVGHCNYDKEFYSASSDFSLGEAMTRYKRANGETYLWMCFERISAIS